MEFSEVDLIVIKFLLTVVSEDKYNEVFDKFDYYENIETIDRVKTILDKLDSVELPDKLNRFLV